MKLVAQASFQLLLYPKNAPLLSAFLKVMLQMHLHNINGCVCFFPAFSFYFPAPAAGKLLEKSFKHNGSASGQA